MLWPNIASEQLAKVARDHDPEVLNSEATFCVASLKSLWHPV